VDLNDYGSARIAMDDWDNFYMLAGGTAGTLIGLIFVVITLGIDHAKTGDALRTRIFVTPILVHFAGLLVISKVMVAPIAALTRAVSLGAIGCAGLAYVLNLALLSRRRGKSNEQELVWDFLLPLVSYVLIATAAAAWALEASFANAIGAIGVVTLLVTAIRNSWMITLAIAGRG
jgi:hypothetical protein